jgi:outer membrane receptor for Fe3+-dicitrate
MKTYFTLLLLCCGFKVYAQDTKETNTKDTLISVEVRADRPVSAASSQRLNKLDFDNRPKNSAQDMLRLVPGLFIAQHAGGGKAEQVFIRGFDCDHGTDVAAYVDGIPVNMASHGHGQGYMDLHFLISETVKNMDVFKGPYNAQFGNFTTAAAVQFNTTDTLKNNLLLIESTVVPTRRNITGNRLMGAFQLPNFSKKITSYFATDIVSNRGYFERSQAFHRFNVFSKTVFAINQNSKLSLSFSGFSSSWDASGQVPTRAVKSGLISRFGSIDHTEGGITSRNNINLQYTSKLKGGEFSAQFFQSDYRFKLFSNFTLYLNDSLNGDQIEQGDYRTIRGLNTQYAMAHKVANLTNKFTIGVNFRSDDIQNELWSTVKRTRLKATAIGKINEVSAALYANEVIRFNSKFRIELGGRFDYFTFNVDDKIPTDSSRTNYSGYNFQTLFSPKVNVIYATSNKVQFFINSGSGFHSNDARSTVQDQSNHQLPRSFGAEIGSLFAPTKNITLSFALWNLNLENELVYVGDDGTTENKGSSRRTGIDFSARYQVFSWLFTDVDLNISDNSLTTKVFGKRLAQASHIPLSPTATSAGGFTFKQKNFGASIRYRYLGDRAANETNTVIAEGYIVLDLSINYKMKRFKIAFNIENALNVEWNEAQFDTESKLQTEKKSVSELHYTPGTPFAMKLGLTYLF